MLVKAKQAASLIISCIKAKIVVMLAGSPGTGKSQIIHQIAEKYSLKVIDLRLSQCDPTDLSGFPTVQNNKATYLPMDTFPVQGDTIPSGYVGWLLFLDEFNSASTAVSAAAYKLVLDRMVGSNHLHSKVAIVAAGNLETDNAITNPMSTAMQSRLTHIQLQVDYLEWLSWANENGINHQITSFINFKPGMLYTFQPDHTDYTYACPRSWEATNKLMVVEEVDSPNLLPMLAGTLSEGVAREFLIFCKIQDTLPKIATIISNPENTAVPIEPSVLYALSGSLSHHVNTENIDSIIKYVKRMPVEFQVICIREMNQRNRTLINTPSMQEWATTSFSKLY